MPLHIESATCKDLEQERIKTCCTELKGLGLHSDSPIQACSRWICALESEKRRSEANLRENEANMAKNRSKHDVNASCLTDLTPQMSVSSLNLSRRLDFSSKAMERRSICASRRPKSEEESVFRRKTKERESNYVRKSCEIDEEVEFKTPLLRRCSKRRVNTEKVEKNGEIDEIPVKMLKKNESFEIGGDKLVKLYRWSVAVDDGKVFLRGFKEDDSVPRTWQSSRIKERVKKDVMKSATGTMYSLVGAMDAVSTIKTGISKETASKFRCGFPRDWLSLLLTPETLKNEVVPKLVKPQEDPVLDLTLCKIDAKSLARCQGSRVLVHRLESSENKSEKRKLNVSVCVIDVEISKNIRNVNVKCAVKNRESNLIYHSYDGPGRRTRSRMDSKVKMKEIVVKSRKAESKSPEVERRVVETRQSRARTRGNVVKSDESVELRQILVRSRRYPSRNQQNVTESEGNRQKMLKNEQNLLNSSRNVQNILNSSRNGQKTMKNEQNVLNFSRNGQNDLNSSRNGQRTLRSQLKFFNSSENEQNLSRSQRNLVKSLKKQQNTARNLRNLVTSPEKQQNARSRRNIIKSPDKVQYVAKTRRNPSRNQQNLPKSPGKIQSPPETRRNPSRKRQTAPESQGKVESSPETLRNPSRKRQTVPEAPGKVESPPKTRRNPSRKRQTVPESQGKDQNSSKIRQSIRKNAEQVQNTANTQEKTLKSVEKVQKPVKSRQTTPRKQQRRLKTPEKVQKKVEKVTKHKISKTKTPKKAEIANGQLSPVITARPGTITHQRQVLEAISHQNKGYEADFFSAAGFKLEKLIKLPVRRPIVDLDNLSDTSEPVTPNVPIPVPKPASRHRTPEPEDAFCQPYPDELFRRKEVDSYIHNRRKKGQGPQVHKRFRDKSVETSNKNRKPSLKLEKFDKMKLKFDSSTDNDNFKDEGEESDFYFTDED